MFLKYNSFSINFIPLISIKKKKICERGVRLLFIMYCRGWGKSLNSFILRWWRCCVDVDRWVKFDWCFVIFISLPYNFLMAFEGWWKMSELKRVASSTYNKVQPYFIQRNEVTAVKFYAVGHLTMP